MTRNNENFLFICFKEKCKHSVTFCNFSSWHIAQRFLVGLRYKVQFRKPNMFLLPCQKRLWTTLTTGVFTQQVCNSCSVPVCLPELRLGCANQAESDMHSITLSFVRYLMWWHQEIFGLQVFVSMECIQIQPRRAVTSYHQGIVLKLSTTQIF